MTFDFHPEAREEFHDAAHWYEDRSLDAGDRLVSVVRAAINGGAHHTALRNKNSPIG
jgi:hypothetical protein